VHRHIINQFNLNPSLRLYLPLLLPPLLQHRAAEKPLLEVEVALLEQLVPLLLEKGTLLLAFDHRTQVYLLVYVPFLLGAVVVSDLLAQPDLLVVLYHLLPLGCPFGANGLVFLLLVDVVEKLVLLLKMAHVLLVLQQKLIKILLHLQLNLHLLHYLLN